MDVIDYIYDECHRQHVTNYGDFANALNYAEWVTADRVKDVDSFGEFVQWLAAYIEPTKNITEFNSPTVNNLRTSHVGFMHGGSAAPAGEVRERFDRWCELAFDMLPTIRENPADTNVYYTDQLIKQLLDIHPWVDGNGRTASILRNWMLGTLDDPSPLPYYYSES